MSDFLGGIEGFVDDFPNCKRLQNYLLELVESLYRDLETERNTTVLLQKTLQDLTREKTFGITSKFVSLKAEHAALREQLSSLQSDHDDLNIQLIAKGEETKHLLNEKQEELQSHFTNLLKEKEETVKKAEQEVETTKRDFATREQELYKEMVAVETAANLRLDKMEADFRKQYLESHKKLKDNMDTCTVLRMELMSVKEQFAEYKRASNEKIAYLQKRLREDDSTKSDSLDNLNTSNSTEKFSKYKLSTSFTSLSSSDETPMNLKQVPVFRRSGKNDKKLPPLIAPKPVVKKRKLFNPDDLSYLADNLPN